MKSLFKKENWIKTTINEKIIVGLMIAFLICDMISTFRVVWKNYEGPLYLDNTTGAEAIEPIALSDGQVMTQTFKGTIQGLSGGEFHVDTKDVDENASIILRLVDTSEDKELYEEIYGSNTIADTIKFTFPESLTDVADHELMLEISTEGIIEENPLYVSVVPNETLGTGSIRLDDTDYEGDLSIALYAATIDKAGISTMYRVFMILLLLCVLLVYIRMLHKKYDLARDVFLPVALIVGVIYMVMLPPFIIPDEGTHFNSAYALSNKMLGIYDRGNELLCRQEERYSVYSDSSHAYTYSYVLNDIMQKTEATENTAQNPVWGQVIHGPILMYGPGALGITIARLLKLGYTDLILWGRFFNMLCSTICLYGAIKLMPFRKEMLLVVSCFPMAFQQRASYSYDGMTIALIFMMTAYLLRLIYEKESFEKKDYLFMLLGLMFATPVKLVYFMVAFLIVLIPNEKFKHTNAWITKIVYLILAFVFNLVMNADRFFLEMSKNGADTFGGYTLSELLSDLPGTAYMFFRTVQLYLGFYIDTIWGRSLGCLVYAYTGEFTLLVTIALGLSLISRKQDGIKAGHRWLFALLFFMSVGMSMLSMLMAWTAAGTDHVEGVQGRYFLPMLPLLLMCVPEIDAKEAVEAKLSRYAVFIIVFVNAWMMSRLFDMVMLR